MRKQVPSAARGGLRRPIQVNYADTFTKERSMPFSYYDKLTRAQKKTYRHSDEIHRVSVPNLHVLAPLIPRLAQALLLEHRDQVAVIGQSLLSELAQQLHVPPIRVTVYAERPRDSSGELHGFYEPSNDDHSVAHVSIWMRTAQRKRVVAFRTFLRTLLHEFCHHLDYELFGLPETFHTEGFYKRESSLLHQLMGDATDEQKTIGAVNGTK